CSLLSLPPLSSSLVPPPPCPPCSPPFPTRRSSDLSSSFQDFSNFCTPSSSRTRYTSSRSTPTAERFSNTVSACCFVPLTVSPVIRASLSTVSIVSSGMVLTVPRTTSSST